MTSVRVKSRDDGDAVETGSLPNSAIIAHHPHLLIFLVSSGLERCGFFGSRIAIISSLCLDESYSSPSSLVFDLCPLPSLLLDSSCRCLGIESSIDLVKARVPN
ncbi:hypothetical protein L1887_15487 [Cichorium endivia]|nr:hypothetical protein L1887_15487 [Cichorium endivia]